MRSAQFFFPGEQSADRHRVERRDSRAAEEFYRERWRHDKEVRARTTDPVAAWAELAGDRSRVGGWQQARGKGGFQRGSWAEVAELIAAAQVHTIKTYGPDRIVGFSPIPAMSMVSYAAGTR